MCSHVFGGNWTEEKLKALRGYLDAYTIIFTKNEAAKKLTRTYVDAFAGTGYRQRPRGAERSALELFAELVQPETQAYLKGSARIALETEPPFHRYLFIERDLRHVEDLEKLKSEFPEIRDRIRIERGDANDRLRRWCDDTDWRFNRAVVFLDPYGMQTDWATIEALARTQGVDLWMLFPLGLGVMRLLKRAHPPEDMWAAPITRILGSEDWKESWYPPPGLDLFGQVGTRRREVDWNQVSAYVVERLRSVFVGVAPNPRVLTNSKNNPLYLLCFAASNPKGAKAALRIANHLLRGW